MEIMIEGFDKAAAALQPKVVTEVTWFLTPKDKGLVSPESAMALTNLLLLAFLAGFQSEAIKGATKAGKIVFGWLKQGVTKFFRRDTVKEQVELEKIAKEAPKTAAGLAPAVFELVMRQTVEGFSLYLKTEHMIPEKKSEALTAEIERLALKYVFAQDAKG